MHLNILVSMNLVKLAGNRSSKCIVKSISKTADIAIVYSQMNILRKWNENYQDRIARW